MTKPTIWRRVYPRAVGRLIGLSLVIPAPGLRAQVTLNGLEEPLQENVLVYLDLDDELCDAPVWRVRDQFARAEGEIGAAVEAFGFYEAEISSSLSFEEDCWAASFDITLGEPVSLRQVDISVVGPALEDPAFSTLIAASGLAAGEVLRHGDYNALKRDLLDLAVERGYAEAVFTSARIDVFPEERAADMSLQLDSGPRYSFGEIELNQDVLNPGLLERYYEFGTGDPYDRSALGTLYVDLVDSGYFASVEVRPLDPDPVSKSIPILIDLTAGTRLLTSYGVGFSTDTGPRLRTGRTNRRLNDRGAQQGVNAQLSPVISELSYNYRFPYGDPRSEWLSLDAGIKHEDTDTAVSDSLQFVARRIVGRPWGWQETQFIDLLIEDFEIGLDESRSRLLTPGVSWLRVEADNALRPERGYRLEFEVTGASDSLGSDTNFMRFGVTGKWVHSFANRGRLLFRGRFGAIWERSFNELPPSVRFFAGGDNSVRGYKFESLGPRDADGRVIGGNRIAVASLEYEHPLRERWGIAFFADSGNAFRGGDFQTKSGVGVGVRWQSPLGPIRVDLAFPLNNADRDPRLHVSLGADL